MEWHKRLLKNKIMEEILGSLDRYVNHGTPTGGFLQSVLENDLFGAMSRADHVNKIRIHEICVYIYNNLPIGCYGSKEAVEQWLKKKKYDNMVI